MDNTIDLKIDTKELDEVIAKVKQLVELLKEAQSLLNGMASSSIRVGETTIDGAEISKAVQKSSRGIDSAIA